MGRDSRGYPRVALTYQRVINVHVGLSTETNRIETAVVRYGVASIFATVENDVELDRDSSKRTRSEIQ